MKKKLFSGILILAATFFCLSGCGKSAKNKYYTAPTEAEDYPLYIPAIPDISDDFIRGVDASEVLALENSGVKYYDYDGTEADVFKILAESGVNWVRFRIWNDPYDENGNPYGGGNCDVDTAVTLSKRATDYGLKVLIDFHYSDFWADPGRQLVPKAWKDMDIDTKIQAVHDFTYDALDKLCEAGADIEMIQVGNETNNGLCGEIELKKMTNMMGAGSKAAREISEKYGKNIKVAVHLANPEDQKGLLKRAKRLSEIGLDYDVFAISYYPFWHGKMEPVKELLTQIRETYGVEVMIAETSYPFTDGDGDGNANSYAGNEMTWGYVASVQGQASMIRDVCKLAVESEALGVFYWGGIWVPIGPDRETNFPLWEKYGSGWATSHSVSYDPKNVGDYYGGSAWDNQALFGFDGHPLDSLRVFKYLKYGTISESEPEIIMPKVFDAEGNALRNASFEDGDYSMWEVAFEGGNPTDFQEKVADAHSGDFAFHFWSQQDMDFTVSQTVEGLSAGNYKAYMFSQGGDMNAEAVLTFFVTVTDKEGNELSKTEVNFEDAGWAVWQNPEINGISVGDGDIVTVGAHIHTNKNSWGTLDDFALCLE